MDTKLTREARKRLSRKRYCSDQKALQDQGFYRTQDPSVKPIQGEQP